MRFPPARGAIGRGLLAVAAVVMLLWPSDVPGGEAGIGKAPQTRPGGPDKTPKPDPFVVPNGTPEQILKYLDTLGELEPSAQDPETISQFNKKAMGAVLEAADKIFAGKPTEAQADEAAKWKFGALAMLNRLGDKEAGAKLKALPAELERLGWKKLARVVEGTLLGNELGRVQEDDAKGFLDLLARIQAYLAQGQLGRQETGLAMETAFAAERFGTETAVQAYEGFAKVLAASPNKELAPLAAKMLGSARRLTLVGKPMDVAGQTLSGKPLDWAAYRGKVVLVSFWATWCGPCRGEIENIRKNYAEFHPKGFDVVAVSIDKGRPELEDYMKDDPVPWTVLFDGALESGGADKTMATAYGILRIPQLLLVGKDGNVIALDARGPRLRKLLTALLGEPAAQDKGPSIGFPPQTK